MLLFPIPLQRVSLRSLDCLTLPPGKWSTSITSARAMAGFSPQSTRACITPSPGACIHVCVVCVGMCVHVCHEMKTALN